MSLNLLVILLTVPITAEATMKLVAAYRARKSDRQ